MAENGSQNTITKWRDDFMVASDSNINLESGHFLNPIFPRPVNEFPNLSPHAFTYTGNNGSVPFHVNFKGWQTPYPAWNAWVHRMEPRHGPTWRSVGIYHAIKSTTANIILHEEVIMALARKWFSETKTFVFKWGEASITIEDVYFLGGFPPLGDPITQNLDTRELLQADKSLKEARRIIQNSGLNKVPFNHWIGLFQRNANEFADIEHAAFLVFWLSKFVFTKRADVVGKHVHSIAIRLSMGVRIALAPAVLASIYKDLRNLNSAISGAGTINIDIDAPMHLLQIWAWERFPYLKPQFNLFAPNHPIMARWSGWRHASLELSVIGLMMETSADVFSWRPYVLLFENQELTENLYEDMELRARVYSELDPRLTALVKFVRPSELKGFGCIEQYLPHRVARQFGYDQDLPAPVLWNNQNCFAALADYNRPVEDQILYLPPKLGNNKVTSRYLIWWKRSKPHVEVGLSLGSGNEQAM